MGRVVISDRYLDSNIVYQGFGGGERPEIIEKINLWATEGLCRRSPLLDLDVENGLKRLQKEIKWKMAGRPRNKGVGFSPQGAPGYLARCEPSSIVIEAEGSTQAWRRIWQKQNLLKVKNPVR